MSISGNCMNKTNMFKSSRFRTPAGDELKLGIWVDRIGEHSNWSAGVAEPPPFRLLGLHAAVEIVSGQGFFEIQGASRLSVSSGDIIIVRPQEPSRYWPDGEWLERFIVWGGPEAGRLSELLMPSATLVRRAGGVVSGAYERLGVLMERDGLLSAFERKLVVERMLLDLCSDGKSGLALKSLPSGLRKALALIAAQDGHVRMSQIARNCGLSETHLRRLFRLHAGMSPKDYAMSMRISRAKSLLCQGLGIKEVATLCGFPDVFHFMRTFKRLVGVTAGSYAKTASLSREGCF